MNDADKLLRRGLLLEYITLGWNVAGSGIVLAAAVAARSVALAGFGLDSLVEIGASMVVIWQLKGIHDQLEQRALRFISIAFLALAVYISAQSIRAFLLHAHPAASLPGIVWLALTFAAMLALATAKRDTGMKLGNKVLTAEARVTLVDAWLAGSVLLGLIFNALFGW
jgi:divalent metal cation (Fe/Co/Zn/Cd) transporter